MVTEKQREVLKAIYHYINANGISPSVRNLCNLLRVKSSSTVHGHLTKLEKQGLITKKETVPRSVKLTEAGLNELKG